MEIASLILPFLCLMPFDYDLHESSLPGKNGRTVICLHGYGANYQIAHFLKEQQFTEATLVSFNFPDHDLGNREVHPNQESFGTIRELLPALYVMKQRVVDQGLDSIDLYGFSAGGGALVNAIGVLNTTTYDTDLKQIGIGVEEKKKLLTVIQKGIVLLDTPLKSIEEIIDLRGSTEEFEILAQNYRKNGFRPIDSLESLRGLSLNILLHFQKRDEILSNRDDHLYIQRLKSVNSKGKMTVIIEDDGGHMAPHPSIWESYSEKTQSSD
jgi:hypothetical protein